jgi:hypothetical protein
VPWVAEDPGRVIGDGMVEVRPGTPEYKAWLPFVEPPSKDKGRRILDAKL